jgi:flagella basal body P-ring formation protein FlgA
MISILLAVTVNAAPTNLLSALQARVLLPEARVEVLEWREPACRGALEVPPIESSGRVAVRVRGEGCSEWTWATIRLLAKVAVLTRELSTGDALEGAYTMKLEEVRRGRGGLSRIPQGATATRRLRGGQSLTAEMVRVGPPPGSPVTIRLRSAGLEIEQRGTSVACTGMLQSCAVLPGGKHVRGSFENGAITVAMGAATSTGSAQP